MTIRLFVKQETPKDPERWLEFRWFALGLGLLLLIRFHGIFLGTDALTLRDFSMFGYPIAAHLQQSLFAGELPLWNPLNHAGTPFLAQWNTMVLYPPMLITALLPLTWSLSVFCIFHQLLGGLGAWQLAHRCTNDRWAAALAGVAFVGHGLVQNSLMWPNNIAALGWLPWLILLAERAVRLRGRTIVLAVLVGGLQMLTGGPEVILLTWLLVGGMILTQLWHQGVTAKEAMIRIGITGCLALTTALLAAAQLLPFLELLALSHRGAGYADGEWALVGMAWARFFTPLFGAVDAPGRIFYDPAQSWTHSIYAGLPIVALAFAAPFIRPDRRIWILAWAGFVCLIIAMGPAGYLYPILAKVPPFHLLRFPVKFVIPLTIILPILAGIGFARIRTWDDSPASACCGIRLTILFSVIALGWTAAFVLGWSNERIQQSDWIANSLVRLLGLVLVVGAVMRLIRVADKSVASGVIIAVVAIDLQIHQPNLAPTIPATVYQTSTPALESLRAGLAPGGRAALSANAILNLNANSLPSLADTMLLRRTAQFGNANLIDGLPNVDGFYSLQLRQHREVQAILHTGANELRGGVADFLGVTRAMYHTNMFHWQPRAGAMPLVSGGQRPMFQLAALSGLDQMANAAFDPRQQVVLDDAIPADTQAVATSVEIADLEIRPHRIGFQAIAERTALVVIAQSHHPAWQAEVNGQPARIHKANHAFQAVQIGPGKNTVTLRYQDSRFRLGCWLSLATFVACLIALRRCGVRSCNP